MVFITAGMGGGTGTGASPIVADICRELGAITIAVVTKPFTFEGPRRARAAEKGIEELKQRVDAIITIPNDKLLTVAEKRATLVDSFRMADDILRQGVQGVSISSRFRAINVDFNDVRPYGKRRFRVVRHRRGEGEPCRGRRHRRHQQPLLNEHPRSVAF